MTYHWAKKNVEWNLVIVQIFNANLSTFSVRFFLYDNFVIIDCFSNHSKMFNFDSA